MGDNTTGSIKSPTNGVTVTSNGDSSQKTKLTDTANLPKLIIPDSKINYDVKPVKTKPAKKKRRDKSDLGDNFVAPDGGWGWFVSVASGVNILVTFALAQQFGIIFREHMAELGITSSQLTSIINIQVAVSAITGLLNGPLFRRFSFRQVALFGSFLTFIGLFACVFANSFLFYCLSFSCCYGFGRGLTVSASSLAVNTYFKERRRTATAYQFGVAGLGPICLPYVATFLLDYIGVEGTVLFFAGLSLNTVACSLIYQPVKWHVKKQPKDEEAFKKLPTRDEDDHIIAQPVEPETPVLPRANDGWFGSKTSLNSPSIRNRLGSWDKTQEGTQLMELKRLNSRDNSAKVRSFSVSHSIKEVENEDEEYGDRQDEDNKEQTHIDATQTELELLRQRQQEIELKQAIIDEEHERRKKLPWYMKVVVFFDLDLLRDITYVNLSLGLTLINFVEINFAILTPFILSDFGFQKHQIALAMSLLGTFDLIIRFLIPLITAKINLSNKTFFVLGILGMCIGRIFLSFTRNFYVMIGIFIWLGLNKAFRTVFWSLIIPGYVPLKRLPAAAGLQLLMSGLFSLAFGPLIGLIRDNTNYAFALNFLNALCLLAIAGWVVEAFVQKYRNKSKIVKEDLK
ncbi:monocarboxylate transporter 9 [Calliphora vicina]|uniref:monocarboxylate transporter 9 n=1 Tax=Calliphora vicina TaxID=7373 RepID=UPI00325A547D